MTADKHRADFLLWDDYLISVSFNVIAGIAPSQVYTIGDVSRRGDMQSSRAVPAFLKGAGAQREL